MKEIISEIALRCDDVGFNDFPLNIYERAYERATRVIAKKYSLFQRIESFTLSEYAQNLEEDCILELDDFNEEISVIVNDTVMDKVTNRIELTGQYYLHRIDDELKFNYALLEKALTDKITIIYTCLPTINYDEGEFYIPHRYEEELIREIIIYMARVGVVKFKKESSVKYQKLLQLYMRNDTYDKDAIENKEWIAVKVWQPY